MDTIEYAMFRYDTVEVENDLKACKINHRKKCVMFLRGGGESPEERPYDVFRGQNRYVTLP